MTPPESKDSNDVKGHGGLAAHAIGAGDPDEARAIDRALALGEDAALAAELAELGDAAALLAVAIPYETPDPAVRARLLAATEGRFARFAARFAEMFDVAIDRARDLLAMADSPRAWEAGPGPGSWLLHFQAGPRYATADAGFVKLAPGVTFPWHHHHGAEQCLVLHGGAADSLSGNLAVGDEPDAAADTEHEFRAVGDDDFIFAVRVFGVEFDCPRPADQPAT